MSAKTDEPAYLMQIAVAAILAESDGFAMATPKLLQAICEASGWDVSEAWVADPDSQLLRRKASWHTPGVDARQWESACQGISVQRGRGVVGQVWATGAPAWILDLATEPEFLRGPMAAKMGLHAVCAFPIGPDDSTNGVIVLFCREPRQRDDHLLSALTNLGREIGWLATVQLSTQRDAQYFRELIDGLGDIVAVIDLDGTIKYENPAVERVLGYGLRERIGRKVFDFIHPDDLSTTFQALHKGMQDLGSVQRIEVRARHRNGSWVWLESLGSIRADHGTDPVAIVTSRDITDRKRSSEALRSSERRLNVAVNSASVVVFGIDPQGTFVLSEGGGLRALGRQPKEVVGRHVSDVYKDVPDIPRAVELALNGESIDIEIPVRNLWFRAWCNPLIDDAGNTVGAAGLAVDITEAKGTQWLLEQQSYLLEMIALGSPGVEVLHVLAETLETAIVGGTCCVWSKDDSGRRLAVSAAPSLPEGLAVDLRRPVPPRGYGSTRQGGQSGHFSINASVAPGPAWERIPDRIRQRGMAAAWSALVPAPSGDVSAMIDVYFPAPRSPEPFEEHAMRMAARVLGVAAERAETGRQPDGTRTARRALEGSTGPLALSGRIERRRTIGAAAAASFGLTESQLRVLRLLARGLSNKEIGSSLSLSHHTVKEYVGILTRKLGVRNRSEAAAMAAARGLT